MAESQGPGVSISEVNTAASEITRAAPQRTPIAAPAEGTFHAELSEFAANVAGSLSPFGQDVEFPLPLDKLSYRHPGPANRPALAGD